MTAGSPASIDNEIRVFSKPQLLLRLVGRAEEDMSVSPCFRSGLYGRTRPFFPYANTILNSSLRRKMHKPVPLLQIGPQQEVV
jgi:hypothetical protein